MPSRPPSIIMPFTQTQAGVKTTNRLLRWVVVALLIVSVIVTTAYTAIAIYIATQLVYTPQKPLYATPASLGLQFKYVTFPSRMDQVQLKGWFIAGVLPNGKLTSQRTIILVHGTRANRADKSAGLLNLSGDLARHGFAVLAFDMRGSGESPPAPLSLGYFEQRDVLGAVDFLRSGPVPYPDLGRPKVIGGWGISMGGATMLLAAAQEPAIRGVVADSAYAAFVPLLERNALMPGPIIPGVMFAMQMLYGINFDAVRPVDAVV